MEQTANIQTDPARAVFWRPEAVFVAAAVTLLGAMLLPVHPHVLDVLWVCAFCLAGAAIFICMIAKSSVDLIGFVPILSVLTLLRIGLQAVTARKIIAHDATGVLAGSLGTALTASWPLAAVLVGLVLSVVFVVLIFGACQRIAIAACNYLRQILPLKQIGVETDLRMGIISETNAQTLADRITTERRFFAGMNSVSLLMRGEAAISIFIFLACLIALTTSDSFKTISQEGLFGPVMVFPVFSLFPAVIVSVSCGGLMSRETLALQPETGDTNAVKTKKVTIVSRETGDTEEIELLNPDFVYHAGVDERIVEFEPADAAATASAPPQQRAAAAKTTGFAACSNPGEYYKQLAKQISRLDVKPRTAILASEDIQSLPVTVAVNIAINLAQEKQKVLLVDTDTTRNALAQVFELDPKLMQKKVLSSCLENLSACCVPLEKVDMLLKKRKIADRFDTLLIYAPETKQPGLKPGPNRSIFYFTDETKETTNLQNGICPIPGIQSILK